MNLTKRQVKAFLSVLSDDSTRPVLTQASIELYNGVTHIVATDGYTLAAIPVNGVADIIGHRIERSDIVKWYKLASAKDTFTDENVRELARPTYTDFGDNDTDGKLYGKYPEWQKLIPSGDSVDMSTISINSEYLLTMQTLINNGPLMLNFYGKNAPVVIRGVNNMLCVVMPCKS